MPSLEPVRQLLRVAIHLFAEIGQIESMALLVPGQLDDQIIGDREIGVLLVVKNAKT